MASSPTDGISEPDGRARRARSRSRPAFVRHRGPTVGLTTRSTVPHGPGARTGGTGFAVHAGTERDDLWRVALDVASDEPVLGLGGGGFQYTYLARGPARDRERAGRPQRGARGSSPVGFPALAGARWAGQPRAPGAPAASGPEPPRSQVCALTASGSWNAPSLDWFWAYPLTAPPRLAAVGSASGRCGGGGPRRWRPAASVAAVVLPSWDDRRSSPSASRSTTPARLAGPTPSRRTEPGARPRPQPTLARAAPGGGRHRPGAGRPGALAAFTEAADKRPEE